MPAKTHIALSIVLALVAANASSSPHADSEEDAIFRVVRDESGWVCLGQIIQMAPA